MNFYVVGYQQLMPPFAEYPCIRLTTDNWNDYNIKTLFHMQYYSDVKTYHEIGSVKIQNDDNNETVLPQFFTKLDDLFCSLGQDVMYYQRVRDIFLDSYDDVLSALNDVVICPESAEKYQSTRVFQTSLLRWSDANTAFKTGRAVLSGSSHEDIYSFEFSCHLPGADLPHNVVFNFNGKTDLPNRVFALVGKNGTGKTQYLSKMANALSGQFKEKNCVFNPYRPLFRKVIAISYSAFDKFRRPVSNRVFSYKYCGLKDSKGFISQKKLVEIYQKDVEKIVDLNRVEVWEEVLSQIIPPDLVAEYKQELFKELNFQLIDKDKSLLSSGQSVLMYVITEVIADICNHSLILFDEPEMHLHPNAIANLIRMLNKLLVETESYAIVATHSPIIIQEVPSMNVVLFDRIGNTPYIRELPIETFGENLSVITECIFNTVDVKETYKDNLESLASLYDYSAVNQMFNDKLSLNSRIYLRGLYPNA